MNGFFFSSTINRAFFIYTQIYAHSKQFLFHYVEMQTKCYTKQVKIEKGERDKNVCVCLYVFSQQRKWK